MNLLNTIKSLFANQKGAQSVKQPVKRLPLNEVPCLVKGITKSIETEPEEWAFSCELYRPSVHYSLVHKKSGFKIFKKDGHFDYSSGMYGYNIYIINGKAYENDYIDPNPVRVNNKSIFSDFEIAISMHIKDSYLYKNREKRIEEEKEKKRLEDFASNYFEPLGCPKKESQES